MSCPRQDFLIVLAMGLSACADSRKDPAWQPRRQSRGAASCPTLALDVGAGQVVEQQLESRRSRSTNKKLSSENSPNSAGTTPPVRKSG